MDSLDHLSAEQLAAFYRGELSAGENKRVIRHLLSGCDTCAHRSADHWDLEVSRRQQRPSMSGFDAIFERAARAAMNLGGTIEQERKQAPGLAAELESHPMSRRRLLVANSRRFVSYGLTETLLETAFRSGFQDSRRAIEEAELALQVAKRLPSKTYGERLTIDLRARAWGTLGNAQRIASRLTAAERSLERALELADHGTGDPYERARLLSFVASLRTAQQRFAEALTTDDRVLDLYQTVADHHFVGRTLAHKAFVLRRMGENDLAIEISRRALNQLDPERDLHAVAAARQGLAHSLLDAGRMEEASTQLDSVRRAFRSLGNDLDVLRCDWFAGKILLRRGRTAEAVTTFAAVQSRLVEREMPYDAALAALDLSEALFEQGRMHEVVERLGEAIPIFQTLDIHREAIAALLFLRQAAELGELTARVIRWTADFVRSSQTDPIARFHPPLETAPG